MIKNMTLGSKPRRIPLMLGLLLGIISAALIVVYLGQGKSDSNGGGGLAVGEITGIVVANQNITAGTKITQDMVTVKQIPLSAVVQGTFKQATDVVGTVAISNIASGEQVLATRVLAATDAGQVREASALADAVPVTKELGQCGTQDCGLRALSVEVSPLTAAAGLVRNGDRVDVVLAFQDGGAITILQDVEFLALDQDIERVVSQPEGESGPGARAVLADGKENSAATAATLAVWPNQAMVLAAGEEFVKGEQLELPDSIKAKFGVSGSPSCKGSVRLTLRHTAQMGPVGSIGDPRGLCASLFDLTWGDLIP